MNKKIIRDADLKNKRVFLRADLNVPLKNGEITDSYKISATLPTIKYILDHEPKSLIIGSHLGRPGGKVVSELSLRPVFIYMEKIFKEMDKTFSFRDMYATMDDKYILLENLRFVPEEEDTTHANSEKYKDFFRDNADITVIDAFGVVHREAGSLTGTSLPVYSGLLIEKELSAIKNVLNNKIDLIILGGLKVSDKIKLIKRLIPKTRNMYIGGGMAFTFVKNQGIEIGDSIFEDNMDQEIQEIFNLAKENDTSIMLPIDFCSVKEGSYEQSRQIKSGYKGVDLGSESISMLKRLIEGQKSVFWNGPVGIFEDPESSYGTKMIVEELSKICQKGVTVIAGGGDTASAVAKFGHITDFTHVSTGGGSMMSLLQGDNLPGIEIIDDLEA